jgi:hypothetical protein
VKKKVGKLIIALTVLVSIAAGYYGWRYWQLVHDGTATTAISVDVDRRTITGKNLTSMPWRYAADYTFADASGSVHAGRETIDRGTYDKLAGRAANSPVTVHYSRSRPGVNTLDIGSSRTAALALIGIALFGWVLVLFRSMRG